MSDRGGLFIFSILTILASLGAAVWLVISGQAVTVDGLFLVLTALLTAAAFGLYIKFVIGRAIEAATPPAPPAKPKAPQTAAKPAPTPVA
jgi:membrane protein DedA with SNARE-associated domain